MCAEPRRILLVFPKGGSSGQGLTSKHLEMKGRIAVVNATPRSYGAGGEYSQLQIASALAARGHDVTLLNPISRVAVGGESSPIDGNTHSQIEVRETAFNAVSRLETLTYVSQPLPPARCLDEFDCSLLLLYRFPTRRYLRALRDSESRVAFLLHGIGFERSIAPALSVRLYQRLLRERLASLSGDFNSKGFRLQVLTNLAYRSLVSAGINPDLVRLIRSGVDFDTYDVGQDRTTFSILHLGRLSDPQKGIGILLRTLDLVARRQSPKIHLNIAGSGTESKRVERWVRSRGQVTFHGRVSERKKRELLTAASVFLVTSQMEPFSIATVEALASGVPVVSTPVSGPSEILGSIPDGGVVSSFAPEILADAVFTYFDYWQSDPESYCLAKIERRKNSIGRFDMSQMQSGYVSLAEELLK